MRPSETSAEPWNDQFGVDGITTEERFRDNFVTNLDAAKERSSTYASNGAEFKIEHGSGPLSGLYSQDPINIGNVPIDEYLLAEVTDVSGLDVGYILGKFDGILGLDWDSLLRTVSGRQCKLWLVRDSLKSQFLPCP